MSDISAESLAHALSANGKVVRSGDKFKISCVLPQNHKNGDIHPSFEVGTTKAGKVGWKCHGGCNWKDLTDEISRRGLNPFDSEKKEKTKSKEFKAWEHEPVDIFYYYRADGSLWHEKKRYWWNEDREMRFWHDDGSSLGKWTRRESKQILYNLPAVAKAAASNGFVICTEGETDIKYCLNDWNLPAFSLDNGCEAYWLDRYVDDLKGVKEVYFCHDNDAVGYKYSNRGCKLLTDNGIVCKWVDLPGIDDLKIGADVRDWKAAGHTAFEFIQAMQVAQVWTEEVGVPARLRPAASTKNTISKNRDASNQESSSPAPFGSDLHIAQRVISSFGEGNLVADKNGFYSWTEIVWAICDDKEIENRIIAEYEALNLAAQVKGKNLGSVLRIIKALTFNPKLAFDEPSDLIHCQNGAIAIEDGQVVIHDHEREHFRLTVLPWAYDPEAMAPTFWKYINSAFEPREELNVSYDRKKDARDKKQLFIEGLAYGLLQTCKFEKYFLLKGDGSNGKSKAFWLVEKLYGGQNVSAIDPSQFANKFQLGFLHRKLANVLAELKQGAEINDDFFKKVTSGDPITAEHKNRSPFTFRPYCTLFLGTNHEMPHTKDLSHAFFRRPLIIEFNNKFFALNDPDRKDGDLVADTDLESKLMAEMPGIFKLAVDALISLLARGGFLEPASSIAARKAWRMDADLVAQCVNDACRIGPGLTLDSDNFYKFFRTWALDMGVTKIMTKTLFRRRLSALGFTKGRDEKGDRVRMGLTMKEEFSNAHIGSSRRGSYYDYANN